MEKNRQLKIMFIVALVLSITAMTLGFAAFSTTLNISSSATVTPNTDAFGVRLVSVNGDNKFEVYEANTLGNKAAIINSDGLSVSGVRANLSKPGDKVIFYGLIDVYGQYDVYFAGVRLLNIPGENLTKKCTPVGDNGASTESLNAVCSDIIVSYAIKEYDVMSGEILSDDSLKLGDVLKSGEKYFFRFSIAYKPDAKYVDGDFEIVFGDAMFDFSTLSSERYIGFEIGGYIFNAKENMTWEEWVNSEYNTLYYTISNGKIYYNAANCIYVSGINLTDKIEEGKIYSHSTEMFCAGVSDRG